MDKLIDYACDELEKLEKKAEKSGLSLTETQYADTLAHLKKNLLKGEEMYAEMEDGYSGTYRGSYRGGSYEPGSMGRGSYRGGSYARGRNARRDSRGRYSSEGGYSRAAEKMVEQLRDMMHEAPDQQTRMELERMVQRMEQG